MALLFFDLDRLKAINDYLGHTAGDWFIRVFADRLCKAPDDSTLSPGSAATSSSSSRRRRWATDAAEAMAHRLQEMLRERVASTARC